MKKSNKTTLITLFIIFIVFMAGKYLVGLIFEDMCGNDIKQKTPSPNGENVAYIFERSCGATTGFSPQLSIINKDDNFQNKPGNTFRTDKDFSIEWVNEKNLKVIFDKSSETYKMDKQVNEIKIEYVDK